MSTRYEHLERTGERDDTPADHEISLGTTTVLAIFVGFALLCGVFFGFGYSMGRKSMLPTLGNVDTHVSAPQGDDKSSEDSASNVPDVPATAAAGGKGSANRPSANTAEAEPEPASVPRTTAATKPNAATAAATGGSFRSAARDTSPEAAQQDSTPQRNAAAPRTPSPSKTPAVAAVATTGAAASASGQSFVQVAAISHREDADLLLASLHRRGYNASIRQLPQDNLLHIQIGPLGSKKDAETMRQRLLSDGYNAIVK